MNRRHFFGALVGASAQPAASQTQQKFYITGGRRVDPNQNDCNVSPLVCYGRDRLDAVANSGITVWHAAEWESASPRFQESCRQVPKQ